MRFQESQNIKSVRASSGLRRRHVRRSAIPKARMAGLRTLALRMRSLFTRQRSHLRLAENLMVGSGPIADSAHILETLASPRLKMEDLLELMHASSATASQETSFGKERHEVFVACMKEHLKSLDDVSVYRMRRKMESRRMQNLRGSLLKASRKESSAGAEGRAVGKEFTQMSDMLEDIEGSLAHELQRRGFSSAQTIAQPLRGTKRQAQAIDNFAKSISQNLVAGGGSLPPSLRARFDDILDEVNDDLSYAGAFCERLEPMSGHLAVTEDFLRDYGAQEIRFEDSDGVAIQESAETGQGIDRNDEDQRLALSNHLLDFCEGREGQALRLSRLMTKETSQAAWGALVDFRDGGNPYLSIPEGGSGRLYSRSGRSPRFVAQRMENGDIRLEMRRAQDLQGFRNAETHRFQFYVGEKSSLDCEIGFHIPASAEKPVRLDENSRYSYQLLERPATALAELPAHWANAV